MKKRFEDKDEMKRDEQKTKYFIFGILIGFLMVLFSIFMGNNNTVMASGIIIMGITIMAFPLCTPETVKLLGYRKSKQLGRILGIIMIVLGIWIKMG